MRGFLDASAQKPESYSVTIVLLVGLPKTQPYDEALHGCRWGYVFIVMNTKKVIRVIPTVENCSIKNY